LYVEGEAPFYGRKKHCATAEREGNSECLKRDLALSGRWGIGGEGTNCLSWKGGKGGGMFLESGLKLLDESTLERGGPTQEEKSHPSRDSKRNKREGNCFFQKKGKNVSFRRSQMAKGRGWGEEKEKEGITPDEGGYRNLFFLRKRKIPLRLRGSKEETPMPVRRKNIYSPPQSKENLINFTRKKEKSTKGTRL